MPKEKPVRLKDSLHKTRKRSFLSCRVPTARPALGQSPRSSTGCNPDRAIATANRCHLLSYIRLLTHYMSSCLFATLEIAFIVNYYYYMLTSVIYFFHFKLYIYICTRKLFNINSRYMKKKKYFVMSVPSLCDFV